MSERLSFLEELKRRNVLRVGAFYAGVSWVVMQAATQILPFFHIAESVVRWIVVAAVLGFPFALAFAWFYEITPQGLKLESEVDRSQSITRQTGRKLDRWIIAALGVAVVLLLSDKLLLHRQAGTAAAETVPAKSIAVLPFANTGGDAANEYFSDGLSEELINTLGHVDKLKVMGRASSFRFKDTRDDPRTIGEKLGVGYLVDGSVRKAADRVRIGIELVRTDDGSNLWSESYDRDLKDIFAVQTEIATAVTGQLQRSLGIATTQAPVGKPAAGWPPSGSVEAYQALLQGKFYHRRATGADEAKAMEFYKQAITLDPRYALAHAELALSGVLYVAYYASPTPAERDAILARSRAAADTALQLEPDLAQAHSARGAVLETLDLRLGDTEREYERAAELAPNDPDVIHRLGLVQATRGRIALALATLDRAAALDPLSRQTQALRGSLLDLTGRYDEAETALRKAIELEPQAATSHAHLAITKMHQGDTAAAVAIAREEPESFWKQWSLAMVLFAHGDRKEADAALDKLIRENGEDSGFQIAEVYAARKDPDAAFRWLDRAFATKDPGVLQLYLSSLLSAYRDDPRYAAFARKVGLDPPDALPLPKSAALAK